MQPLRQTGSWQEALASSSLPGTRAWSAGHPKVTEVICQCHPELSLVGRVPWSQPGPPIVKWESLADAYCLTRSRKEEKMGSWPPSRWLHQQPKIALTSYPRFAIEIGPVRREEGGYRGLAFLFSINVDKVPTVCQRLAHHGLLAFTRKVC